MKNSLHYLPLILLSLLLLNSCGRRGPVGPQGPPGIDGAELLPASFEFNVDLLQENGFEDFGDIPNEIDVIPEDVLLAFVLEDETQEGEEVWRQLPLIEFRERGTVAINFDFTVWDIRIFMEANYPLQSEDGYQGLLIRAVHIPANYVAKMKPGAFATIQNPNEVAKILGMEIISLP